MAPKVQALAAGRSPRLPVQLLCQHRWSGCVSQPLSCHCFLSTLLGLDLNAQELFMLQLESTQMRDAPKVTWDICNVYLPHMIRHSLYLSSRKSLSCVLSFFSFFFF